jgi:hypothetical protein
MVSKILFTLAVAIGVLALFRWRRQRELRVLPSPRYVATDSDLRPLLKWLSIAVIVMTIGGASLWLLHAWRDAGEIVTVRVFDVGSGAVTEYEVYRSDLEVRSFRTVDGRRVVLAETDRMETLPAD